MKKKPREKILTEVQKKAFEYEKNYYGCSQCVLLAVQDVFDLEGEETFKAAWSEWMPHGCEKCC